MALPQVPTTPPLAAVTRHPAALLDTMRGVERALAVPTGRHDWLPTVTGSLGALRSAFAAHVSLTEGPDGLYTELVEHAPRLANRIRRLLCEHAVLAIGIDAICSCTGRAGIEDVRGCAGSLLRDLSRHRQHGADIIYEAYATDIGGET